MCTAVVCFSGMHHSSSIPGSWLHSGSAQHLPHGPWTPDFRAAACMWTWGPPPWCRKPHGRCTGQQARRAVEAALSQWLLRAGPHIPHSDDAGSCSVLWGETPVARIMTRLVINPLSAAFPPCVTSPHLCQFACLFLLNDFNPYLRLCFWEKLNSGRLFAVWVIADTTAVDVCFGAQGRHFSGIYSQVKCLGYR